MSSHSHFWVYLFAGGKSQKPSTHTHHNRNGHSTRANTRANQNYWYCCSGTRYTSEYMCCFFSGKSPKKKKTKENRHSKHTQKLKSKRRQSQQSHPYQIAPSSSSSSQHQQLVAARHCVYDTVFSGHFDRELRTMPAALAAFIAPNASVATP